MAAEGAAVSAHEVFGAHRGPHDLDAKAEQPRELVFVRERLGEVKAGIEKQDAN